MNKQPSPWIELEKWKLCLLQELYHHNKRNSTRKCRILHALQTYSIERAQFSLPVSLIMDTIIGQIQNDSEFFLKLALEENRGLDLLTYSHQGFKLKAIVNPLSCWSGS